MCFHQDIFFLKILYVNISQKVTIMTKAKEGAHK